MASYEAMPAEKVLAELGSSESKGLGSHEAQARLKKSGRNEVETKKRRTALGILVRQFSSPLVLILVLASVIAGSIGEFTEAAVIVGIVVINSLLSFVQEYRSEKALEKLARYIVLKATVLRDGERDEVDARELVPGDIIFFETGNLVPADVRLISVHELFINQSLLTGESAPAEKNLEPVKKASPSPQEMACVAFMGTSVASGAGTGVVIATGKATELGRTAAYLKEKPPQTDFERNVKLFSEMLLGVVVVMTVFIFAANALLGKDILLSLLFALAIAVGITPELLPAIITISLSNGALMLASKKVIVKRLDAIEDLGNVDVLCTDKTGTLTENAITLKGHENSDGKEDDSVLFHAMLASPIAIGKKHKYAGMAMDAAIWEHTKKRAELARKVAAYSIVDEVAFDYERRVMSVVSRKRGGELIFVTKGSPESVIPRCTKIMSEGREEKVDKHVTWLMRRYEVMSEQGLRVLAVAVKKPKPKAEYSKADETGLTFLGFLMFSDPPRKTAAAAFHTLKLLGVEMKILSGDEPRVTAAICTAVGMELKGGRVVTGSELAGLDRAGLRKIVEQANVFARMTPGQKLDIISALKENGHVVGFIGDGVNDAPSLHSADAGISVDSGADIAKESADIILLRHGLHVIADGIVEGRKTFTNTVKYMRNTVSANFGNMLTLAFVSPFMAFIPLLPSQILLNNFVSDFPLTTISTDRVDLEDLRKPGKWSISGITKFMVFFGLVSTVFDFITMMFLAYVVKAGPELFRTGWFIESVLSEILVTFAIRSRKPFFMSRPSNLLLGSSLLTIAAVVLLVYSPFAYIFQFVQPDLGFLGMIGAILLGYFAVAELCKLAYFHFIKV